MKSERNKGMLAGEMRKRVDQLKQQGNMSFVSGATEEQILAFEHKHSVSLPKKYKEWLQFSDGGECFLPAGVQFYGVAHKPLIDVDDPDRPDSGYIVIGALSSGDPILCEKEGERISIFNHEGGRIESDETYADFYAFIDALTEILGIGG